MTHPSEAIVEEMISNLPHNVAAERERRKQEWEDRRATAIESYWQAKQGEDYGSY